MLGQNLIRPDLRLDVAAKVEHRQLVIRWLDIHATIGEHIQLGTGDRWIRYCKSHATAATAMQALGIVLAKRFKHGQTVVVSGPFFYDRTVRPYWWCEFGLATTQEPRSA